jgi:hypothetical protein
VLNWFSRDMAWHTILDFDKSGGAGNHSRNITLQF